MTWFLLFLNLMTLPLWSGVPVPSNEAAAPHALALDSLGIVWTGAGDDLLAWDGRHLMRQDSWDGWEGGRVQQLVADDRGRLWIKADSGLFLRDETFQRIDLRSAVAGGMGRTLLVTEPVLWLGTRLGLLRWHPLEGERVLLAGMDVRCLVPIADGELLCGTMGRGLFRFDSEGNPAPMPEHYRTLLPEVLQLATAPDGDLLLLGHDERQRVRLAGMDERGEGLRLLAESELPAGSGSATGMLFLGGNLLIRLDHDWLMQGAEGRWRSWQPDSQAGIPLPAGWARLWPGLGRYPRPGSLAVLQQGGGVLVLSRAGMQLAWKSSSNEPTSMLPVQFSSQGDRSWILLEDHAGRRRLLEQGARGVQDLAHLLAGLEDVVLESICPEPDGTGLIVATSQALFVLSDSLRLLEAQSGAHWLEPFTSSTVLVAGEQGLALLEDRQLLPLKVRERVRRAVPDAFGGILAACDSYLLRLNELNEVDTLRYPEVLEGGDSWPGDNVRSVLADRGGRIWLLSGDALYFRSRDGAPWTRPFEAESTAGKRIHSIALDGQDRIWISTTAGTGYLLPDRIPPVIRLLQDPRQLNVVDRKLELDLSTADPMSSGAPPLLRLRLDNRSWSPWMQAGRIPLGRILPHDLGDGSYRLHLQAVDSWGNLSRGQTSLPLVYGSDIGRLPFVRRLFLLLAMVGLSVLATVFYSSRGGLLFSLVSGVVVGFWILKNTNEPLLWWALPIIQLLSSRITSDQLKSIRRKAEHTESEGGVTDLVDRFREFGHSGAATRNIDRLLRSSRNLYLDGRPDPEINGRFQTARGVYLDLTGPSLEELLKAFRRLNPDECPVVESELDLFADIVSGVRKQLESCGDPPAQNRLEELAFQLDRLEKTLVDLEHRVDLQVSSSPLKVLDRVLEHRSPEMAGVELGLECDRDVRQVLARLPVDKLQFILDNLVDNALYWMKEQETRRLVIMVQERPSTLQIRIRDTGPGVPDEKHETIFHAGVSGRATGGGGTGGYGLYRSREVLARYGGSLSLESSSDSGSTFLLEIKKVEAETR